MDAAPDSPTLAEAYVPVPQVYKDLLVQNRGRQWLFVFGCFAVLIGVWYMEWRRVRHIIDFLPHIMILVVAFPVWLNQVRKPWRYVINEKAFRLIQWTLGGRTWQRHNLDWKQDVVLRVEETEWRSLPALRVIVKLKGQKGEQDLWMVYTYQDQEKIQREVLPLIAKFRKKYRHELWADLLRA